MLVDAVQRGSEYYWYIVVLVPFGPLVYFLAIKIHDYDLRGLRRLWNPEKPPLSIEALRSELRRTPSYANRLRLANALHDAGRYEEAAKSFEIILENRPDEPEALHGLGRCRIELGEAEAAIEPLVMLVHKHRTFRDYAGCLDLADAYAKSGRDDDAVTVLQDLVKSSARLHHRLALARQLVALSRIEEAQVELQVALDDHEHAPDFARKRDRVVAREAKIVLESISPKR
jgi:hypothetical protein